jgi:hypothetical protein
MCIRYRHVLLVWIRCYLIVLGCLSFHIYILLCGAWFTWAVAASAAVPHPVAAANIVCMKCHLHHIYIYIYILDTM